MINHEHWEQGLRDECAKMVLPHKTRYRGREHPFSKKAERSFCSPNDKELADKARNGNFEKISTGCLSSVANWI